MRESRGLSGKVGFFGGHGAGAPSTLAPPPELARNRPQEPPKQAEKDELPQIPRREISKLHPSLATLNPTATVAVQVWLNTVSPEVIEKLKKAGLTITTHPSGGALVTGNITAAKLHQLESIEEVRFISPVQK
jgi:hypothetical protein